MATKKRSYDWLAAAPDCIAGDLCDARDWQEALHLATIQLDRTQEYTPQDVKAIKAWIAKTKRELRDLLL